MSQHRDETASVDAMIQEVLDGTASEATRTRLRRLREQDPKVAARYEQMRRTFSELDDLEPIAMPRRVEIRTSARPRLRRRTGRVLWPVVGAVAAALVGVFVFGPHVDDELGSSASGTMIAGGEETRAIVWRTDGVTVDLHPGTISDALKVGIRAADGERRIRLVLESPGWTIAAASGAAEVGRDGRAVAWTTRAARSLEADVTFSAAAGAPEAPTIRLEVDDASTVRTLPPEFLNISTNSGTTGRY